MTPPSWKNCSASGPLRTPPSWPPCTTTAAPSTSAYYSKEAFARTLTTAVKELTEKVEQLNNK